MILGGKSKFDQNKTDLQVKDLKKILALKSEKANKKNHLKNSLVYFASKD